MSNVVMGLRLKQQLTLTPRLQQSVKLLQLSALECVHELNQAMEQNPFLEEPVEETEVSAADDSRNEQSEGIEDRERDYSTLASSSHGSSDDTPDWTEWTPS